MSPKLASNSSSTIATVIDCIVTKCSPKYDPEFTMLIEFGNVNGWNPMHDHNSPGHKLLNRLMFMLEVEETEEERGDQELSLADFTEVVLEEYSGELCQISLNARFGGAQYRTVKVRREKEKMQTNILVDTTSELKSSL
jgi:hypothetical protein